MSTAPGQTEPLRCLSVQQPFAWAICAGVKAAENRTWATEYRGLVAIHAGASRTRVNSFTRPPGGAGLPTAQFTYGAVIGVAELFDVAELSPALEGDPSACGPTCWLFRNALLLPSPVSSRGRLQLYTLGPDETEQVRRQLPGLQPTAPSAASRAWATALHGDPLELHLARGASYCDLGRFDDAIRHYDLAAGLDSSNVEVFANRAAAYLQGWQDFSRTIADCDRALALDPGCTFALMVRALAWRLAGDEAKAAAEEGRAEQLSPGIVEQWEAFRRGGGEEES